MYAVSNFTLSSPCFVVAKPCPGLNVLNYAYSSLFQTTYDSLLDNPVYVSPEKNLQRFLKHTDVLYVASIHCINYPRDIGLYAAMID